MQRSRQRNRRCGSAGVHDTRQRLGSRTRSARGAREHRERHRGRRLKAKSPFAASRFLPNPNHSPQQSAADPLHPSMGLRSPLLLVLLLAAAAFRPGAAAFAPPTGSLARSLVRRRYRSLLKCGPIGGDSIPSFYLLIRILLTAFCAARRQHREAAVVGRQVAAGRGSLDARAQAARPLSVCR
jgi:hypothetical protein